MTTEIVQQSKNSNVVMLVVNMSIHVVSCIVTHRAQSEGNVSKLGPQQARIFKIAVI